MNLSCACPEFDGSEDWWYELPVDYMTMPHRQRRVRCKSCGALIDSGATVIRFCRFRRAADLIEERIFGDGEVALAPWWHCEECADLYWSLSELGFCVYPADRMRDLVAEYREAMDEDE